MRHSKELKDVMRRRRARQDRYGMSSEDYNTVLRKQDLLLCFVWKAI